MQSLDRSNRWFLEFDTTKNENLNDSSYGLFVFLVEFLDDVWREYHLVVLSYVLVAPCIIPGKAGQLLTGIWLKRFCFVMSQKWHRLVVNLWSWHTGVDITDQMCADRWYCRVKLKGYIESGGPLPGVIIQQSWKGMNVGSGGAVPDERNWGTSFVCEIDAHHQPLYFCIDGWLFYSFLVWRYWMFVCLYLFPGAYQ